MKYVQRSILLIGLTLMLLGGKDRTKLVTTLEHNNINMSIKEIPCIPKMPRTKRLDSLGINSRLYLATLSLLESGGYKNPYAVVNQFGYMGKYQFGVRTLRRLDQLGYINYYSRRHFLNSPDLQELAIDALITHNHKVLNNYGLYKYVGITVRGVRITMEGMLAGAHLVGPKAVKDFIIKGRITKDGNNTTITTYMKKFENV